MYYSVKCMAVRLWIREGREVKNEMERDTSQHGANGRGEVTRSELIE